MTVNEAYASLATWTNDYFEDRAKQTLIETEAQILDVVKDDPEKQGRVKDGLTTMNVTWISSIEEITTALDDLDKKYTVLEEQLGVVKECIEENQRNAIEQAAESERRYLALQAETRATSQSITSLQTNLSEEVAKLTNVKREYDETQSRAEEAARQLESVQAEQQASHERLQTLEASLREGQASLRQAEEELERINTRAHASAATLATAQAEQLRIQNKVHDLEASLTEETEKLTHVNTNLEQANARVDATAAELETARNDLDSSIALTNTLKTQLQEAEDKYARGEAQRTELEEKVQVLEAALQLGTEKLDDASILLDETEKRVTHQETSMTTEIEELKAEIKKRRFLESVDYRYYFKSFVYSSAILSVGLSLRTANFAVPFIAALIPSLIVGFYTYYSNSHYYRPLILNQFQNARTQEDVLDVIDYVIANDASIRLPLIGTFLFNPMPS